MYIYMAKKVVFITDNDSIMAFSVQDKGSEMKEKNGH
jgi:hypothetical protein